MATYFIHPILGSDANSGTNYLLPRKTMITTPLLGDNFKYAASPQPVNVSGDCMATWTDNQKYVDVTWTAGQAPFYLLDEGRGAWVGVAGKVIGTNLGSNGKNPVAPYQARGIQTVAGATAGKFAYLPLGNAVDLSAYSKLSFWLRFQVANAVGWQIKLCSDTTGDVAVNTFTMPDSYLTTGTGGRLYNITLDNGAALGTSIQSIALYNTGTVSTSYFVQALESMIVSKPADDSLTMTSLIGKGTGSETYYGISYITDYTNTGCKLWLDTGVNDTGTSLKNYTAITSGLVETLPLKKREPFTYLQMGLPANVFWLTYNRSNTAASPASIEGGYTDFSSSTADGETWIDQGVNHTQLTNINASYLTFKNFGLVRAAGVTLQVGLNSEISNVHLNNHQASVNIGGNNSVARFVSINHNSAGLSAAGFAFSKVYLDNCSGNVIAITSGPFCKYLPWTRDYVTAGQNGVAGNTVTGLFGPQGENGYFYNFDIRNSAWLFALSNVRGTSSYLINSKIASVGTITAPSNSIGTDLKFYIPDFNQSYGDYRIYSNNGTIFQKVSNTEFKAGNMLSPNAVPTNPSLLKISEFAVLSGQQISINIDVKRSTITTFANFIIYDDMDRLLTTSANTSAAINTYETITINHTPTQNGFLRLYWNNWTTATTGTNEVTIKPPIINGMATQNSMRDFNISNGGSIGMPNISSGKRIISL